jgi:hypothetical protein
VLRNSTTLTPEDLLAFYQGEEAKEKFKPLEKEIANLGGGMISLEPSGDDYACLDNVLPCF